MSISALIHGFADDPPGQHDCELGATSADDLGLLVLMTGGCGTAQNLQCSPESNGNFIRAYGGVQASAKTLAEGLEFFPDAILFSPFILAPDVIGDTITLPYVLAKRWRQDYEWAERHKATPSTLKLQSGIDQPEVPTAVEHHSN